MKTLASIYDQNYRRYYKAGLQPRPVEPGTKGCKVKDWQKDVPLLHRAYRDNDGTQYSEHGIGLRLGTKLKDNSYLVAIDADRDDFVRLARALVPSPCGRIGSKGVALFARVHEPTAKFDLKLSDGSKAGEFLGNKSLIVIPPTLHPVTRQPYRWTDRPLLELTHKELPQVDPGAVRAVFASEHLPVLMSGVATHDAQLGLVGQLFNLSDDLDWIERVVRAAFPENYDGNSLAELPGMIRDTADKFDSGEWIKSSATTAGGAPRFSEEHLAQEFAARHDRELRYVKNLGWLIWGNTRWQPDERNTVFSRARALDREFARQADAKLRRAIASAKTRAAVVSLAQDDERLTMTAEQWDRDPWLLNTPGGTVELRSGRLRPHARGDYITKSTAVAPDPTRPTPLWSAFLDRVTAGERELQDFLQRACGYSLTGLTSEHALFFLYGTGANGKSTFIEAVRGITNDYARPVPMETLMWSRNERHPTDIAGLRGARIASAIETGKGRGWDEPKIMMLTGGDKITARLMRQDFFDFTPQFKLWVATTSRAYARSTKRSDGASTWCRSRSPSRWKSATSSWARS
jgi:hypothetical protein